MIFTACEKVVIGQEDNTATLVSILQGFDFPTEPPLDQVLRLPRPWYVFTLWERLEGETPEMHTQRIEVIAPDETVLISAEVAVINKESADARFQRSMLRQNFFLAKGLNDHVVRLSLRTGDGAFIPVPNAHFPIPISVRAPKPTAG